MSTLNIYRNATIIATVAIDEKTVLVKKLMNADKVTSSFIRQTVLPVELGDYITENNQNYYLNQLPTIVKDNENTYRYTMVFHAVLYNLYNKLLISSDGLNDFSYTGNAEEILTFIVDEINKIDAGWTVGEVDFTQQKTLEFINESCRTALTKLAQAFNFEFQLIGKTINLKEAVGTIKNVSFQYGKGKGLYAITRESVEDKTLVTRLYGYGSTKNIPYTYRDHAKRLVFEGRYLEKNVDVYGVREGHYTNDDIYPQRTALLTDVNMSFSGGDFNPNESYVEDSTLDFNINDFLAEGKTAKIVFKSGDLSGYEFEIWKVDFDTKRIYFNPFNEADGYVLPNETNQAQVGDTYTLVDLKMPPSYIIQAETDLLAATQKYLDENAVPKILYLVKLDPKYIKAQGISLDAGDLVNVVDAYLGIDRAIRISQISYPLVNKNKMSAIIADFIPYSLQEQVTRASVSTSRNIRSLIKQITNTNNTTNINNSQTIINEGGNVNKISVFDRLFTWEKGFDNTDVSKLEYGDFIMDNHYNRVLFVKKWMYIGDADTPTKRNARSNWDELETIEL